MYTAEIGNVGEVIIIQNVSRYFDGYYMCIAENGVANPVSRKMSVTVECKSVPHYYLSTCYLHANYMLSIHMYALTG